MAKETLRFARRTLAPEEILHRAVSFAVADAPVDQLRADYGIRAL